MYLSQQSIGRNGYSQIWNLEYYVIFVYFFFNSSKPVLTEIFFLCWPIHKKFTFPVKSKQKRILHNIRDSKIREYKICHIDWWDKYIRHNFVLGTHLKAIQRQLGTYWKTLDLNWLLFLYPWWCLFFRCIYWFVNLTPGLPSNTQWGKRNKIF